MDGLEAIGNLGTEMRAFPDIVSCQQLYHQ